MEFREVIGHGQCVDIVGPSSETVKRRIQYVATVLIGGGRDGKVGVLGVLFMALSLAFGESAVEEVFVRIAKTTGVDSRERGLLYLGGCFRRWGCDGGRGIVRKGGYGVLSQKPGQSRVMQQH